MGICLWVLMRYTGSIGNRGVLGFFGKLVLWGGLLCLGAVNTDSFAADQQLIVPPLSHFTQGETGRVVRVIDGDSFVLQDGLKVSLFGIQSPKMAWPDKGYTAWPLADAAKSYLSNLISGQQVGLYYSGDTRDRYGRAVAQVWILDAKGHPETWLQQAIVQAGFARVYSWPQQDYDTKVLYAAEQTARTAKRGIWNESKTDGFYSVRAPDPNPLAQYVDSLQTVEGIVISTANVRGTIYLNFGSDYKTDFTIAIAKKSKKVFKTATYDPLALTGARVRVRGWIELQNGPIIWLNDPRRLEVLD